MIKSFRDNETEKIFHRQYSRKLPQHLHQLAWTKLAILDSSEKIGDLRIPPGNRMEKLSGQRAGQYSIRINNQYRICFSWQDGDAYDVEITDYH